MKNYKIMWKNFQIFELLSDCQYVIFWRANEKQRILISYYRIVFPTIFNECVQQLPL